MGAFTDVINLTMPYLRVGMTQVLGLVMFLVWMELLFGRRRSLWLMLADMCYIMVGINWLMNGLLRQYAGGELWWQCLHGLMVFTHIPLNMAVVYYTYKGDFLRVTVGSIFVDLISSVHGILCVYIVNAIEQRENPLLSAGEFMAADLLIIVVWCILMPVLWWIFGRLIKRFLTHPIKHKVLWGILLAAYFTAGMASRFAEVTSENDTMFIFIIQSQAGLVIIGIFVFFIIRLHARSVAQKNDYLRAKGSLLKTHYITLQQQIRQTEINRERNNEKIQRILQAQEGTKDEMLENYLKDLKQQYENIAAGMYCGDWAVDAMLVNLAAACRKKEIRPDFQFQKYDPGEIREEDILQIIGSLGETAIRQSGKKDVVKLQAEAVKNQLMFRCTFSGTEKLSGRYYRELLKRYQGSFQSSIREGVQTVTVVLPRDGITGQERRKL